MWETWGYILQTLSGKARRMDLQRTPEPTGASAGCERTTSHHTGTTLHHAGLTLLWNYLALQPQRASVAVWVTLTRTARPRWTVQQCWGQDCQQVLTLETSRHLAEWSSNFYKVPRPVWMQNLFLGCLHWVLISSMRAAWAKYWVKTLGLEDDKLGVSFTDESVMEQIPADHSSSKC